MADQRSYSHLIERRLFLTWKAAYQRILPQKHQGCLFVAGMQRSGTNMVMDVLERSIRTEVFHETDPRAFKKYEQREASALHSLVDNGNASVTVFKALLESDLISKLLEEFSPAKTIWSVRNYHDVVNSAQRSFPDLKDTVRRIVKEPGNYWQSRGASPEIHQTLSDHYADDLSIEESAALFWYARNRLYFDNGMDKDNRVLLMRYEDLVTRPRDMFPRMFEFVGIPFHSWHISRVHARSIALHPKPKLRDAIETLCANLYEQYEESGH